MPAQVTLKDIGKVYNQRTATITALASVDLSVGPKEFVCIIGPNGCGKSTLLKLIAGIEQPTSGSLIVDTNTAYVPQQPSLLPWRTVKQNLELPADIKGTASNAKQDDIEQMLHDFGLSEFANMYPRALSGGMQQKVALIRAVLFSPALLLLDEPFAALDALTRLELQSWLLRLRQRTHSAVVCVTHDIHEAVFLADTIYVLSQRPGCARQKLIVKHPRTKAPRQRTAPYIRRQEKTLTELVAAAP
jgi:ABC-type nitrate/sulfonate/bicarbonate transport system ATPase subunit